MPSPLKTKVKHSPLSKRQLLRAARHVRKYRSAPGYDGVSPEELKGKKLGMFVTKLHQSLRDGRKPRRARKGLLPRPGKAPREHAIANLGDAVVLRAVAEALEEVWGNLPNSIVGGRPGGNRHDLITVVSKFIAKGEGWLLRFDIKSAFASASFDKAIARLRLLTDRQDLVDLIVRWRNKQGRHFEGLVEGAAHAPLLLAVMLANVASTIEKLIGTSLLIWLDDGIFIARDRAQVVEVERLLRQGLKEAGGLELHPDKTGIHRFDPTDHRPSAFHFLGVRWRGWYTEPLPEAVDGLLAALHQMVLRDERGALAATWDGWVASVVRRDSREDVLADIDERFEAEIGSKQWPWGPFTSLVATSNSVALRGPRSPRARWLYQPGTSGAGSRTMWNGVRAGAASCTTPATSPTGSLPAPAITTQSSATGAPGAGMGLASGASSLLEDP